MLHAASCHSLYNEVGINMPVGVNISGCHRFNVSVGGTNIIAPKMKHLGGRFGQCVYSMLGEQSITVYNTLLLCRQRRVVPVSESWPR